MDELTSCALRAGAGDRAALTRFVRLSQADVWRLAAHLVDRGAADDITQEVYERVLRALPTFRGDSSARTWVLSIARRTCADVIRRRTRVRRRDERIRAEVSVNQQAYTQGDSAFVDEAIASLAEDRRAAFVLTQLLGFGYVETAEICGCPVGTIRSRVARARADLMGLLSETDGGSNSLEA